MVDDTDDGQIGWIIPGPCRVARRGGPDTNHPVARDAADGIDRDAARSIRRFLHDKQRTMTHGMDAIGRHEGWYLHA